MNKYYIIALLTILSYSNIISQTIITADDITAQNAGEGDLYKLVSSTSTIIYIGLTDGTYHPINKNLQEILAEGNSADGNKIIDLGTPTAPTDAVTKKYVDDLTGGANWLMVGNSPTNTTSFLGTTNDVKMQIRSNNLSMLEFGRRETLGLTQPFLDYDNNGQPLVHLNGDGDTAALQFAASGAEFYKPMFFTTTNGSFRLKGSTGKTDFFEIGSAGPDNEGRLEFIIGDDGAEPIVFKRFDFRDGEFHQEFFRVQGSDNTADAKTRFGININPEHRSINTTYNDDSNNGYTIANSTLQVNGSLSLSIITTTEDLTLTEEHHTVILGGNHDIELPVANLCRGRIYIIINKSDSNQTISTYKNEKGDSKTNIKKEKSLWIQSDGSDWQQIKS